MKILFCATGSSLDDDLRAALVSTGYQVEDLLSPPEVQGRKKLVVFAVLEETPDAAGAARLGACIGSGLEASVVVPARFPEGFDWIARKARVSTSVLGSVVGWMSTRVASAVADRPPLDHERGALS